MIELQALTKPFEVKIKLSGEEFGFLFRQPNYEEVNKLISESVKSDKDFFNELNKLFDGFTGAELVVKDEDGNKLEFKDFIEFLELPLPYSIRKVIEATIIATVSKEVIKAESIEKKS